MSAGPPATRYFGAGASAGQAARNGAGALRLASSHPESPDMHEISSLKFVATLS